LRGRVTFIGRQAEPAQKPPILGALPRTSLEPADLAGTFAEGAATDESEVASRITRRPASSTLLKLNVAVARNAAPVTRRRFVKDPVASVAFRDESGFRSQCRCADRRRYPPPAPFGFKLLVSKPGRRCGRAAPKSINTPTMTGPTAVCTASPITIEVARSAVTSRECRPPHPLTTTARHCRRDYQDGEAEGR